MRTHRTRSVVLRARFRASVIAILATSLVATSGCALTFGLAYKARARPELAPVVEVEEAYALEEGRIAAVFRVRPDDGSEPRRLELEIPAHPRDWHSDDVDSKLVFTADGLLYLDRPRFELLEPAGSPDDRTPIPMVRVPIDGLDGIRRTLEDDWPPGARVVVMSFTPTENDLDRLGWKIDPQPVEVLAIRPGDSDADIVVADFLEGHYRQLGWYALAPLTIVGDIATAPLQLLVFIVNSECEGDGTGRPDCRPLADPGRD